jgi:hypothetical protein
MEFIPGHLYTRREITDSFGGGVQDYLPHKDGRIVCACLTTDHNPDAPEIVLVGIGPDIKRSAEIFAEQGDYVPTFVKRAPHAWQYKGQYRVRTHSTDREQISRWETVSGRKSDISMLLFLEREASPSP